MNRHRNIIYLKMHSILSLETLWMSLKDIMSVKKEQKNKHRHTYVSHTSREDEVQRHTCLAHAES